MVNPVRPVAVKSFNFLLIYFPSVGFYAIMNADYLKKGALRLRLMRIIMFPRNRKGAADGY